MLPFKDS